MDKGNCAINGCDEYREAHNIGALLLTPDQSVIDELKQQKYVSTESNRKKICDRHYTTETVEVGRFGKKKFRKGCKKFVPQLNMVMKDASLSHIDISMHDSEIVSGSTLGDVSAPSNPGHGSSYNISNVGAPSIPVDSLSSAHPDAVSDSQKRRRSNDEFPDSKQQRLDDDHDESRIITDEKSANFNQMFEMPEIIHGMQINVLDRVKNKYIKYIWKDMDGQSIREVEVPLSGPIVIQYHGLKRIRFENISCSETDIHEILDQVDKCSSKKEFVEYFNVKFARKSN